MSRKIDHNHYKKLFQKDSFTNYITQLYIIVYENLFTRDDSFLVDKNSHKNSINISQNNNIKMPDRKYFHNTLYADYHKKKFGIQLKISHKFFIFYIYNYINNILIFFVDFQNF